MRIALLDSWSPDPTEGSGTTVSISGLARTLEGRGHEVVRIPAPDAPRPAAPSLLHRLGANRGLHRRILAVEPDVAVGFDLDGFLLPRERPYPLIVQLKGIAADEARFERWTARWTLRLMGRLEGRNARKADRVAVPSRYSREAAVRMYDLDPARVAVVPEGVDPAPWAKVREEREARSAGEIPDPWKSSTRRPLVLSVAHQYPRKNTETLLRALPAVARRIPGVRLRVVGGGPRLSVLRRRAREAGLEDRVELPGAVPGDAALRREYLDADCFCLPSLQEGFGIAFLEAMSTGLPVVAGRAGAVPELVTDDRTGLLVDPLDPDALARALVRVLENPSLARGLGRAGAERARRFTLDGAAEALLELIREVRRGAPAPCAR